MNATPDTTAAGNGGTFGPEQAAALLAGTTQRARRTFEPSPPWFLAIRAVLALVAYGAIWLSVRGQHPYTHPTPVALVGVLPAVVINLVAAVVLAKRATAGVQGRSRLDATEIAVMAAVWLGVFVGLAGMAGSVSDGIVYGLYLVSAPLIAAGLAWAGIMAIHANWRAVGTAAAVAIVGIAALFAGPAGAWAVAGVGLCVVLLGSAAAIARRQRA